LLPDGLPHVLVMVFNEDYSGNDYDDCNDDNAFDEYNHFF